MSDDEAPVTDEGDGVSDLMQQLQQWCCLSDALPRAAKKQSCLSVGGADSGALLFGAMLGRLSMIADLSDDVVDRGLWTSADIRGRVLPDGVKAHAIEGSLFDDSSLTDCLRANGEKRFDAVFLHKTLHHLRENNCKQRGDHRNHDHGDRPATGVFSPLPVFARLFEYAEVVVVSEYYYLGEDGDQETSQGGMLDLDEVNAMLRELVAKYSVEVFRPLRQQASARRPSQLRARIKHASYLLFRVEKRAKARRRPGRST